MNPKQLKQAALGTLKGQWLVGLSISIIYFLIFALAASRMSFDQDDIDSMVRFIALNMVVTIVLAPVTVGRGVCRNRNTVRRILFVSTCFPDDCRICDCNGIGLCWIIFDLTGTILLPSISSRSVYFSRSTGIIVLASTW